MESLEYFEARLRQRENVWAGIMSAAAVSIVGLTGYTAYAAGVFSETDIPIFMGIITFLIGFLVTSVILRPLNHWAERTWLKSYFTEDCGDIVKLHGAVRLIDMGSAYRELLSVRPGFKIADDAFPRFGCTLAAIPATDSELKAKEELESMGLPVNTI